MLFIIWSIAITSIILKTLFFNDIAEWISLSLYLGLGWFGAVSGILLYRRYGYHYIKLLIYGAIAYTGGAILEFMRTPELIPCVIGPHELFRIAVLFGISYHFVFIFRFAQPNAPRHNI